VTNWRTFLSNASSRALELDVLSREHDLRRTTYHNLGYKAGLDAIHQRADQHRPGDEALLGKPFYEGFTKGAQDSWSEAVAKGMIAAMAAMTCKHGSKLGTEMANIARKSAIINNTVNQELIRVPVAPPSGAISNSSSTSDNKPTSSNSAPSPARSSLSSASTSSLSPIPSSVAVTAFQQLVNDPLIHRLGLQPDALHAALPLPLAPSWEEAEAARAADSASTNNHPHPSDSTQTAGAVPSQTVTVAPSIEAAQMASIDW